MEQSLVSKRIITLIYKSYCWALQAVKPLFEIYSYVTLKKDPIEKTPEHVVTVSDLINEYSRAPRHPIVSKSALRQWKFSMLCYRPKHAKIHSMINTVTNKILPDLSPIWLVFIWGLLREKSGYSWAKRTVNSVGPWLRNFLKVNKVQKNGTYCTWFE